VPVGYRKYSPADVERLMFIRRSQKLISACPGQGELAKCPIVTALSGDPDDE
jgi:hypothetical protein